MNRPKPDLRDPEYVAYAHLFNDITRAPTEQFIHLGTREILADRLWELGYRKTTPAETRWGVLLDDNGSIDEYDTREAAERALANEPNGLRLVRIDIATEGADQ